MLQANTFGLPSALNLPLLLWSGLALLTLALLVLMCTRWGQAKPLSKCIALSVFAHILFIAYAYGTRLMFDQPREVQEVPIRLASVALETEGEPDSISPPAHAWNNFASGQLTEPDVAAPSPHETEPATPVQSQPVFEPEFDSQPEPQPISTPGPARPTADMRAHQRSIQDPAPSDLKVEIPQAVPANSNVEAPVPVAISLPRRTSSDTLPSMAADVPSTSPGSLLSEPAQLQRLSNVPVTSKIAEAVLGAKDRVQASDNRVPDGAADRPNQGGDVGRDRDLAETATGVSSPASSTAAVDEQRRLGDGAPLPKLYGLRTGEQKRELAGQFGGTDKTEAAVEAALAWLATNQLEDGRWDASQLGAGLEMRVLGHDRQGAGAEADTGISGLALLAFLGAGQTHFEGKHRRNIQRGLEYLLWSQHADGNLAGDAKLFARMYCHGIASLALSEAYAMTGDERLRPYVERAIAYTVWSQHKTTGGWRYRPGDRGDMSQFGWQLMALKSAELAGVKIPAETRAGMLRFLQEVSSGTHGGLASYRRGEQASRTMTAEALVCRLFLGQKIESSRVAEARRFLEQELPGDGQVNLYYWYYASLSLFQLQGKSWNEWNEALQGELLSRQRTDGEWAGSWDPNTVWGGYGGRVYSTAMAALCLEVYYRYLPIYSP